MIESSPHFHGKQGEGTYWKIAEDKVSDMNTLVDSL